MDYVYKNMTRQQLDKAYNNTLAVDDFAAVMATFNRNSQECYANNHVQRNVAYGNEARTCFDYFPSAKKNAPTLLFIHGGYWQNCTKEDFAFIANGPVQQGFNVILVEYTLAPAASMTQIVREIGQLLDYLYQHQEQYNITLGQVCLSGHSAGGHLTAMHRNHPLISHAMPLSALTDLRPIKLSWLNEKLNLTEEEVQQCSPMQHIAKEGGPIAVHVGGAELPELILQSEQYAQALKACGNNVVYHPVPGCDHFSLLEEFGPGGALLASLGKLMAV